MSREFAFMSRRLMITSGRRTRNWVLGSGDALRDGLLSLHMTRVITRRRGVVVRRMRVTSGMTTLRVLLFRRSLIVSLLRRVVPFYLTTWTRCRVSLGVRSSVIVLILIVLWDLIRSSRRRTSFVELLSRRLQEGKKVEKSSHRSGTEFSPARNRVLPIS